MTPDLFGSRRLRQQMIESEVSRLRGFDLSDGVPAFVGKVVSNASVPTATGVFYLVNPITVTGTEGETNAGVLNVDASTTVFVDVVGSKPPLKGDLLVCRRVDHRWIAERMNMHSSGGVSVPGCPCQALPSILHMTVNNPQSNFGIFQPASLIYGPTPPGYSPLTSDKSCFISSSQFTDGLTGDTFQYYFGCQSGYYIVTRFYLHSLFGSPFRDTTRYRWLIGYPGNQCSPFLLSQGQIYLGGDPSSTVTVTP